VKKLKLNVGCGKNFEPDYVNIDLYEDVIADKKMSALNLEFDGNSCQKLKAIHLIEHLGLYQSIYALSEFFRVLEPNSTLILETPDLERAFKIYLSSDYEQKKDILSWIYGLPHKGLDHKFCFPSKLMYEILEKIGFESIIQTNFLNNESIPTIRFVCKKPEMNESAAVFHVFSCIRKKMLLKKLIDFQNLYLTKEQEDLLNNLLKETLKSIKNYSRRLKLKSITKALIMYPQTVKIFAEEMSNLRYFSDLDISHIVGVADLLIRFGFNKILLNSLMKAPVVPGSQKIIFQSIESFGIITIEKLLSANIERNNVIKMIRERSEEVNCHVHIPFCPDLIRRKSLDIFYKGIKSFYKKDYTHALNYFRIAIKLYRDNFLYYWNSAKVLFNLNLKRQAILNYKRTLRLLNLTEVPNKSQIVMDIKLDLKRIEDQKRKTSEIEPILSLDKYLSKDFDI
jgi:predicted SAM-dependent methyltransferase